MPDTEKVLSVKII